MGDISTRQAKEKKWQETRKWLEQIDPVMPMDAGILEAVTALNVLGIKTAGSCEGYDGRSVPYEQRIILIPRDYISALHIQGACLQDLMLEDERARRLAEYQQEVQTFAAFLKEQFFAS